MGTTSTFHRQTGSRQPSIVVGWAAGPVQVWPDEACESVRPTLPLSARRSTTVGTPDAVLEILASAAGEDVRAYRRRHAGEAGAVLALSHQTIAAVLAAALTVEGDLTPSAVLDAVHDRSDRPERPDRPTAPQSSWLVERLAS